MCSLPLGSEQTRVVPRQLPGQGSRTGGRWQKAGQGVFLRVTCFVSMSGAPSTDLLSYQPVSNPAPAEFICSPLPYWLLSPASSVLKTCLQFHIPSLHFYCQRHFEPYLASWAAAGVLLPGRPNPRSRTRLPPRFILQEEADTDVRTLLTFF